jgi:hypothetical protein
LEAHSLPAVNRTPRQLRRPNHPFTYAEEASSQLPKLRPDVVLPPSSLPLARLDIDAPDGLLDRRHLRV